MHLLDIGNFTKWNLVKFLLRKVLTDKAPEWNMVLAFLTVWHSGPVLQESRLDLTSLDHSFCLFSALFALCLCTLVL